MTVGTSAIVAIPRSENDAGDSDGVIAAAGSCVETAPVAGSTRTFPTSAQSQREAEICQVESWCCSRRYSSSIAPESAVR